MMTTLQSGKCNHVCIVNLGLFRSGTTTLAEASKKLDLRPHRSYYDVPEEKLKEILCNPKAAVQQWMQKDGRQYLIDHVKIYDLICDGFVSLLPLLSDDSLRMLKTRAEEAGVRLVFVATKRDIDSTILSELHHWIKHDLERKSKLDVTERDDLERLLRERAELHEKRINELASQGRLTVLPIETVEEAWPLLLSNVSSFSEQNWLEALKATGQQNKNPSLPIEGILLTLRIGSSEKVAQKISALKSLLQGLERDRLCRYLVVLGIDADEYESPAAEMVENMLQRHEMESEQMHLFRIIRNPPRLHKHFPICEIWDTLACEAWAEKADWVMLLGDDVEIQCSFHYRAFYRAFLDISEKLDVDFGFGCPWWNDKSFPNFPSFPCIGKKHYDIFGGLIPEHRRGTFINQDLDPYIVQLYLKFGAAPCIKEAALINHVGGNIGAGRARYERVPATRWRDFFLKDLGPLRTFVPRTVTEVLFLDVIVPSYRVRLNYLRSIASLCVPKHVHANFIFIVDNPSELLRQAQEIQTKNRNAEMATTANAESILEHYLSCDGNNVRVRCNKVNVGASASRNRGLEESAAEFVLHLDDDLVPKPDLLEKYCSKLFEIDHSVVGLVGIVRFPRSSTLPMKHAAVLMSYLTFMFEIADKDIFDLAYAKTGGGEDVDYSLRVAKACNGGKLLAVPDACVVHPFWPGGVYSLAKHFYSWAIGDGALFKRFPNHCYWSFPNIPETFLIVFPFLLWHNPWSCIRVLLLFLCVDFAIDASNPKEYAHRCQLLDQNGDDNEVIEKRSSAFYFFSHILANLYVVILECGRLRGHIGRMDFAHGMFRRFDWHIGRLPNASSNFRKREAYKFAFFLAIVAYELQSLL